ncbi:HAD-like protein [Dacryopinax primogenitus]|uniref:HAD-like protein n=1 Tax=Dacryopinax primogenitus (strain DJM 731) TaxID=1858805 RepID=M5G6M4_DACPD|nr:HAD-like protein [Dacryopinax primogenitus]EJU01472.1 HAD-like protein [Dacryopinax primogenitus]
MPASLRPVRALCFDLLGTTLDWHTNVALSLQSHASHSPSLAGRTPPIDWARFAHEWRAAFFRVTKSLPVSEEGKPLLIQLEVYMRALDEVCDKYGIGLDVWGREEREEMYRAWWAMDVWPDTKAGVELLQTKYVCVGLTNGSAAYLIHIDKRTGVLYDLLLTSDVVGAYKPQPRMYQTAMAAVQLKPEECAMVASHVSDLEAAKKQGMRSIYIHRETEDMDVDLSNYEFDMIINEGGLVELARRLGVEAAVV